MCAGEASFLLCEVWMEEHMNWSETSLRAVVKGCVWYKPLISSSGP